MSIPPQAEAGPSRSIPTPIRTLRAPHLLTVAQRNDAGGLEPPSQSDAVAYRDAMRRKVELRRRGDKWMERFCEGEIGRDEFKKGVS